MAKQKFRTLASIRDVKDYYFQIEARIKRAFIVSIYQPIIKDLGVPDKTIKNAKGDGLREAIRSGRVMFNWGRFTGKFDAATSREMKALGAVWHKRTASFHILKQDLPADVRAVIDASHSQFVRKMRRIDERLAQISPAEIAGQIKLSDLFDATLWKVDQNFRKIIKGITIAPKLTAEQRRRIADEWQDNMELWIKDFAAEEIQRLRKSVSKNVFAGARYEKMISTIQKSYGVSERKAKFLAQRETKLLVSKFNEVRFQSAGIDEYMWGCVAGTAKHPVRPAHKKLEGKIFAWDNPPITSEPGQPVRRNNPGLDYKCRCFAKPVVRFK